MHPPSDSMDQFSDFKSKARKGSQALRERAANRPTALPLKLPKSLSEGLDNDKLQGDHNQPQPSTTDAPVAPRPATDENHLAESYKPENLPVMPRELEGLEWMKIPEDDVSKKPPDPIKQASKDPGQTAGILKAHDTRRSTAGMKRRHKNQKQKEKLKKLKEDHQFVNDFKEATETYFAYQESHYPPKLKSIYENLIKRQREAFTNGKDSLVSFNEKMQVIQTSIKDMNITSEGNKDVQEGAATESTIGQRLQQFQENVEQAMPRNRKILERFYQIEEEIAVLRAAVLGQDGESKNSSGYAGGIEALKEDFGQRRAKMVQNLEEEARALVERASNSEKTFDKMMKKKRSESRSFFEKLQTDDEF